MLSDCKSSIADVMHNSTDDLLDKNISSYKSSAKVNKFNDEVIPINHLYLNEPLLIKSFDEYRYNEIAYGQDIPVLKEAFYTEEQRKKTYFGEEEHIYCGRFPHLNYCGCKVPCSLILDKISPIQVLDKIFCGPIESVYKTKELVHLQIKYILNVSCVSYTKRIKYFKFLDIFINDNHTENAIKFFKITNRFIDEAIRSEGNILVHSEHGRSRCWIFVMAYLIGRKHMKFSEAYEGVRERFSYAEPNDNYLTQLKHYDLEVNI